MITTAGSVLGRRLRHRWRRLATAVMQPPLILMYHRIAQDDLDPWRLCVSPDNFSAQLELLRRVDPARVEAAKAALLRN